jgi:hypothetical protein
MSGCLYYFTFHFFCVFFFVCSLPQFIWIKGFVVVVVFCLCHFHCQPFIERERERERYQVL